MFAYDTEQSLIQGRMEYIQSLVQKEEKEKKEHNVQLEAKRETKGSVKGKETKKNDKKQAPQKKGKEEVSFIFNSI